MVANRTDMPKSKSTPKDKLKSMIDELTTMRSELSKDTDPKGNIRKSITSLIEDVWHEIDVLEA